MDPTIYLLEEYDDLSYMYIPIAAYELVQDARRAASGRAGEPVRWESFFVTDGINHSRTHARFRLRRLMYFDRESMVGEK